MTEPRIICVADLGTEAGVTSAGATMAETVCTDVLWPVFQHTPKGMRATLFERFFCGLTGAVLAELGPDRTKEVLDAAKVAIDDMLAERAKHAH